ncbi:MAG: response regulator [Deltaproteobacteria bacterium]|nr:response regulator [Deltaproteobacteria bacterium]MCB9487234.1 response regulator [Deltaproteobacteria bacterium]
MTGPISIPERALVVDDGETFRNLLSRTLTTMGFQVDIAADGLEAIELIKKNDYSIVLSDLMMPRAGGLEVLRAQKDRDPDVPVIVITGYASLDTALAAIKEGVYDYITKPFQLEEIKLTVANATEKRRLILQNQQLMKSLEEAYTQLKELLGRREHYSQKLDDVERELYRREREIQDGIALLRRAREHAHQSYDNVVPLPKKNSEEK